MRERRSASASASSAARWAVMSREMPNVPITVPSAARSGSFEVLTQALRPSGNVSRSSKPMIGCPVAMIRCSSRSACAACSSENASKSVLPTASSGALETEPPGELRGHLHEPPAGVLEVHLVGRALQEHVQQPALIERVGGVTAWRCAVISHVKEDRLMSARSRAIGRPPRQRDRETHSASPLISRRRFSAPDADGRIGATAAPRNRRRHHRGSGTAALIAARDTNAPQPHRGGATPQNPTSTWAPASPTAPVVRDRSKAPFKHVRCPTAIAQDSRSGNWRRAGSAACSGRHTQLGNLNDATPRSYQTIGGRRVGVESRYSLADGSYGFAVGHHDPRKLLVIDPSLAYSTFVGGSGQDAPAAPGANMGIAVDSTGAAYITGMTESTDFPVTPGAFETTHNPTGTGDDDVFVTKLNPAGLGGSSIPPISAAPGTIWSRLSPSMAQAPRT